MPLFEFDLESFTVLRLEAESEEQARDLISAALLAVLNGLGETEFAIGTARRPAGESKPRLNPGPTPRARLKLPEIHKRMARGETILAIGPAVGLSRATIHRLLAAEKREPT